jgi:hypothetical protein
VLPVSEVWWIAGPETPTAPRLRETQRCGGCSRRCLCRLGALKSTFPAMVQSESRESGVVPGRFVRWHRTPIPTPHACPHAPCPAHSKNLKKDATNYHSLKRRFGQLAASVVSCGYFWVLASRGGWAWVHWQEIGKLEDLPREQLSRQILRKQLRFPEIAVTHPPDTFCAVYGRA